MSLVCRGLANPSGGLCTVGLGLRVGSVVVPPAFVRACLSVRVEPLATLTISVTCGC